MSAAYELRLCTATGTFISQLSGFAQLEWLLNMNAVGYFSARWSRTKFKLEWFGLDRQLQIWRRPEEGTLSLLRTYFLRYLERGGLGDNRYVILKGPDVNDLLDRRIIAQAAGSSGAAKTGTTDDIMKAYVRAELGAGAAAARDLADLGLGFSVAGDISAGASDSKSASHKNLLATLQELYETSVELGTRIYFDMIQTAPTSFRFETFTNQRGHDRSWPNGTNPIVLSDLRNNLANPVLTQDWRDEWNFVYAAGQGVEADREVVSISDTIRIAESAINRRERTYNGSSYSTTARLTAAGHAKLAEGKPARVFSCDMPDKPGYRFGRNWRWGDKVTAIYEGEQYDVEAWKVRGVVTDAGERITARLEYAE